MQNKNNKICICSLSLGNGGAERSCAMLSQLLDGLGYEVHIAILNDEIDYPYAGKLFNMGLLKSKKDTFGSRYNRFRKLRNYLVKHQIDVVIDHRPKNQYYRELFYNHYVYKNIHKIYVTHSSSSELYLTQKPSQFIRLANKNMANVAVSNYIEQEVLIKAGVQHTTTIYNTFDPAWATVTGNLPEGLTEDAYILAYGRIVDEVKDFRFLIESYVASRLSEKDIKLVILGDGKDKAMLQELAMSLPGGNSILFLPFTSEPFVLIKNALCVTLTSRFEGFPMVLVESLSLGTPVVSLDIVSGPNEIISDENNGLLIKKREVPLFAEAINRMCTNQAFREMCSANAKASVSRFSSEEIAQDWHKLLQNGPN